MCSIMATYNCYMDVMESQIDHKTITIKEFIKRVNNAMIYLDDYPCTYLPEHQAMIIELIKRCIPMIHTYVLADRRGSWHLLTNKLYLRSIYDYVSRSEDFQNLKSGGQNRFLETELEFHVCWPNTPESIIQLITKAFPNL
jgi:hypothetical protein